MNENATDTAMVKRPVDKRKRKKIVLFSLAAALLIAAGLGGYRLFFAEEEKTAVTGKTTYGSLTEAIEGSGTTTPADTISYSVSGKVLEWLVEAGDEVKVGDKLYVLDSTDTKDEIMEYEVELGTLYEQLAELQENFDNRTITAAFTGRVENIKAEEDRKVQSGASLATLVDSSKMKATLYFSYAYRDVIKKGMPVMVSIPEQMLNLNGTVQDVQYVDYVTKEGMTCFSVTVVMDNPGSLSTETSASCWLETSMGTAYAVNDARLEYNYSEEIESGANGEILTVEVVDYQRVTAGDVLFTIDTSSYETQMNTIQKQIRNYEEKIADLNESIEKEFTRYSDIDGRVVSARYSTNRMTGLHTGTVTINNQESMEISINVDELDADLLKEGMDVYVYRTTNSRTVSYPATLSYLSLEASSGSGGVSTFAATITIDSKGELSSGVTVYYSISPEGGSTEESVLAPLNALCSYDDGYYLLVQSDKKPKNAIDPAAVNGSVTEYPDGFYAVPVEVGEYSANNIQILSGVEKGATVFMRYMNAAPSGGDKTSKGDQEDENSAGQMGGGNGQMPSFGGQMPNMGGQMPNMGGQMPNMGGQGNPAAAAIENEGRL